MFAFQFRLSNGWPTKVSMASLSVSVYLPVDTTLGMATARVSSEMPAAISRSRLDFRMVRLFWSVRFIASANESGLVSQPGRLVEVRLDSAWIEVVLIPRA